MLKAFVIKSSFVSIHTLQFDLKNLKETIILSLNDLLALEGPSSLKSFSRKADLTAELWTLLGIFQHFKCLMG